MPSKRIDSILAIIDKALDDQPASPENRPDVEDLRTIGRRS
jgi:hypothetical protein